MPEKPTGPYMDATSVQKLHKDPWRTMSLQKRIEAAQARSEFMEEQVRTVEVDVTAYHGVEKLVMSQLQWPYAENDSETVHDMSETTKDQSPKKWITLYSYSQIEAALVAQHNEPNSRIGVVNMTSPKSPGERYLLGGVGLEDFLFHATTLGPGLMAHRDWWGNTNSKTPGNKSDEGLAGDVIVYSPDVRVLFFEGVHESPQEMQVKMDVFSIAPTLKPKTVKKNVENENGSRPKKNTISRYENSKDADHMRDQIRYMFLAAVAKKINVLIVPAYGCGPGYQHPTTTVAEIFMEVLSSKEAEEWRDLANLKVWFALLEVDHEGYPTYPGSFWMPFLKTFRSCGEASIDQYGLSLLEVMQKIALEKQQRQQQPNSNSGIA